MPNPDLQVTRSGDAIMVAGSLDFSTATAAMAALKAQLLEKPAPAPQGNKILIIDLAGVTNSNSAGLAVLVECKAIAQQTHQQITFHNIPDSLRQISTVCQVDSLI